MMHSRIAQQPLTRGMLEAVEGLTYTTEQIEHLLDLAEEQVRSLQKHVAGISELAGNSREWETICTLIAVSTELLDKIKSASTTVEQSAYPEVLA